MSPLLAAVALFLLITIAAGLVRIFRGPTPADRMLAAQLFGTTGIAIILVLGEISARPSALDLALIFALLAVLTTFAFVRRIWEARP